MAGNTPTGGRWWRTSYVLSPTISPSAAHYFVHRPGGSTILFEKVTRKASNEAPSLRLQEQWAAQHVLRERWARLSADLIYYPKGHYRANDWTDWPGRLGVDGCLLHFHHRDSPSVVVLLSQGCTGVRESGDLSTRPTEAWRRWQVSVATVIIIL